MNCTQIHNFLDDYLDDAISADEKNAIELHISDCTSCHQLVEETKAIRRALRSLPVAEASPDFEDRVFSAVHKHYGVTNYTASTDDVTAKSNNRFFAGFSTAIAASLALWFASTMYESQFDEVFPQVVNLAMSQVKTVRLVIDAPTDLDDVTLSVVLPENAELEGYTGQKQIVWQTKLTKGQNVLALPVTAINFGQGDLVAQLDYGEKTKQFHIVVKTSSDGALIYQINPLKTA